jgi:aryl-alcohol dehydrogenase-like predicted oxidoreductase
MSFAISRYMDDDVLAAAQRLEPIASAAGLTTVQLALAWVLRREEVSSAIVGASRPEQVTQNASAAGIELADETIAAVDEALSDVALTEVRSAGFAREGVKHR